MDRREIKLGAPYIEASADPDEQRQVIDTTLQRRFGDELVAKWWSTKRADLADLEPAVAWNKPPDPHVGDFRQAVANAAFHGFYDGHLVSPSE